MLRYSIIEVLVGILVSVAVILIGGFMVSKLSQNVRFYNRCNVVRAFFSNVDGLKVGSDVRVYGVNVGSVTALRLESDNTPLVEMCLHKSLRLPVDSSASITYADLTGKRYIDITPGADDEILTDGSVLHHTNSSISLSMILDKAVSSFLRK